MMLLKCIKENATEEKRILFSVRFRKKLLDIGAHFSIMLVVVVVVVAVQWDYFTMTFSVSFIFFFENCDLFG